MGSTPSQSTIFKIKTITVKKEELLDKLRQNRDEHLDIFLKAQEKYRELVIEQLYIALEKARSGKEIITFIALQEPINQSKDYNRVISMLEMSVDDHITLSETEFSQYVLNDWQWKR